jgi:hypothetical protein
MMSLDIPSKVLENIVKIFRAFLWKGHRDIKGAHCLVVWHMVSSRKIYGGGLAYLIYGSPTWPSIADGHGYNGWTQPMHGWGSTSRCLDFPWPCSGWLIALSWATTSVLDAENTGGSTSFGSLRWRPTLWLWSQLDGPKCAQCKRVLVESGWGTTT